MSLALAGTTTLGLVALTGPAFAHVTVDPPTAPGGGDSTLAFQVPTEEDNASTTKVQVFFPADHPFGAVQVKPLPGWTYKVAEKHLKKPITTDDGQFSSAVSEITWTATSKKSAIQPGQFEEFDVSLGPLPDSGSLVFKALQTYSNGDIVRWIDPTVSGQPEPAHPAPTVTITPAGGETSGGSAAGSSGSSGSGGSSGSTRADWALGLSVVALFLAAGGVVLGATRKRS
ncbi:MAG: YcnI family protein [Nocardioidaceae bacterium]|nr:YcnI family protein [Nocardioidaceae bacterium]MCL2612486.1 YcnI family protein [Nocardioidaceae bacterium]